MSRKASYQRARQARLKAAAAAPKTKKAAAKSVDFVRDTDSFGFSVDSKYPKLDRTNPTEMAAAREFQQVFNKNKRGMIFVNLPEVRNGLNWEHDKFDNMIKKLRGSGVIQLYATELGKFNPKDFFYDEYNHERMGMITWHEPL